MLKYIIILFLLSSCVGVDILDEGDVEILLIVEYPEALAVSDSFALRAQVIGHLGQMINASVSWDISSPDNASVSSHGILKGIFPGEIWVIAKALQLKDSVRVLITQDTTILVARSRSGALQGRSGYRISGNFTISKEDHTILRIINAGIDNAAPGPVYYLSNSANTISGGIRLGVARSGDSEYTLPEGVTVFTYNYLIVWCDPFNVLLGNGQFN